MRTPIKSICTLTSDAILIGTTQNRVFHILDKKGIILPHHASQYYDYIVIIHRRPSSFSKRLPHSWKKHSCRIYTKVLAQPNLIWDLSELWLGSFILQSSKFTASCVRFLLICPYDSSSYNILCFIWSLPSRALIHVKWHWTMTQKAHNQCFCIGRSIIDTLTLKTQQPMVNLAEYDPKNRLLILANFHGPQLIAVSINESYKFSSVALFDVIMPIFSIDVSVRSQDTADSLKVRL